MDFAIASRKGSLLVGKLMGVLALAVLFAGCQEKWDTSKHPAKDAELDKAFFAGVDSKQIADVPEPKSLPEYKPFKRGPLALSYDPYYVASTDTTGTDTTGTAKTTTGTGPAGRARVRRF